jgi:hypothetical protein
MEAKRTAIETLAESSKNAQTPRGHRFFPSKLLVDLVDLVGIEPTTSSMPWNEENRKS